jgi:myo-inositol-1(or 4)-monophosphatase
MSTLSTPEDFEAILVVMRDAARAAAEEARRGFRRAVNVEHKGVIDLVTEFDRASEAAIRKHLNGTLPFAIVGEEGGGEADGATFYVDPIDGTTNFVHGHPFWCISIGLVVDGEPRVGLVLAPALGVEWSGWIASTGEHRATRRSYESPFLSLEGQTPALVTEACAVSGTSSLDHAMLSTGFPYDRRTSPENNFDAFIALKMRAQAVRRCGAAALDLCLVADGTYDGYWELKLKPWDIAGGMAIVRAAGGVVTDLEGARASHLESRIVATNGKIHDGLVAELRNVRAQRRGLGSEGR